MAQWYRNVPAFANVVENCARGCNVPEFHPASFDVVVCAVESLFVQVTVVPTETSSSAGLNALFPRVDAPMGIVIGVAAGGAGDGIGTGDGDGDGPEYPPHALASNVTANTKAKRDNNISPSIQSLASIGAKSPCGA